MRLKIECVEQGLPQLKAWFGTDMQSCPSIDSFKSHLCERVSQLRNARLSGSDINLFLDDFELLDDTSSDVLRDGDLVEVRRRHSTTFNRQKRKLDGQGGTQPKKRKFREKVDGLSSTSPLESDSSLSSSDSDSDSSSTSSSSTSDSSSASSASSSSAQRQRAEIKQNHVKKGLGLQRSDTAVALLVPPGLGKPSTRSRNRRRRLKRHFDQTASAPSGLSEANSLPVKKIKVPVDPDFAHDSSIGMSNGIGQDGVEEERFTMFSLRNKNKKKNFRQSLNGPVPKKIVFESTELDNIVKQTPSANGSLQPRLIPPSEKAELNQLPSNVFVTSVDVEKDLWNKKKVDRTRWADDNSVVEPPTTLDYGPTESTSTSFATDANNLVPTSISETPSTLDWRKMEELWDEASSTLDFTHLYPDVHIGWKELGINFSNFCPEIVLHVAKVINVRDGGEEGSSGRCTCVMMRHPDAPEDADDEQRVEQEFTFQEMEEKQWRILRV